MSEDDHELPVLLPPLPESQDYKPALPFLFYAVLSIEPRALCVLDKHSTNQAMSEALTLSSSNLSLNIAQTSFRFFFMFYFL